MQPRPRFRHSDVTGASKSVAVHEICRKSAARATHGECWRVELHGVRVREWAIDALRDTRRGASQHRRASRYPTGCTSRGAVLPRGESAWWSRSAWRLRLVESERAVT